VSDFIRADAIDHGVQSERITTVHNAISALPALSGERAAVRAELGLPADAPVIGIVGRLDPDKGQADTLEAFIRIAPEMPQAHLVIVGDGPKRAELTHRAEAAGVESKVLFTGFRTDVPRVLTAFDIFSHPSRREPFGLAVLEASAAGLPVVAYAEGGICEIVKPEVTGLLCDPGNIESLVGGLRRLLHCSEEARALGRAGRQHVEAVFRPEHSARVFHTALQTTLERHRRRHQAVNAANHSGTTP
jgi:glycosyltransferase involved in cell wall biosynthesis